MDRKGGSRAEREDKANRGGHSPIPVWKSFPALAAALCCLLLASCQGRVAVPPASSQAPSTDAGSSSDAASSGQPQQAEEGLPQQEPDPPAQPLWEEAVLAAVLQENAGRYLPGEFQGAGCRIIGVFQEGQETAAVYALINYTEYGFEDGRFVNLSGTGARVLIHFDLRTGSGPTPIDYTVLDPTPGLTDAQLEDGIRYVYETQYDSAAKAIRYTKTRYDTGEAAESLTYDAATGQRLA